MDIKVVRALLKTNSIQRAVVLQSENNPGKWVLKFEKDGEEDIFLSLSRREETKIFVHLVSAIEDAKKIGFKKVEVILET